MLCEKCGKNVATTHIHTVINGVVKDVNLCGYCAALDGYNGLQNFGLANLISSVFGQSGETAGIYERKKCPCCGATVANIAESGLMGCSECYDVFYEQVLPTLNRLHGKTDHVGKAPKEIPEEKDNTSKISELRGKLERAIEKENFELAAKLRDEIKLLKEENENE